MPGPEMASVYDKLRAESAFNLEELKKKSIEERKKRGTAAQKLKQDAKKKRLAKERQHKEKRLLEIERQQKQNKLDANVVVNLKKVVDRLLELKEEVSFSKVVKNLKLQGDQSKLLELLKKNKFVQVKDGTSVTLKYKGKYDIENKQDMLQLLHKVWKQPLDLENVQTVIYDDLKDCYKAAESDLQDMLKSGEIFAIINPKSSTRLIFCPDLSEKTQIDGDVISLWNEVKVNSDDIDNELLDCGITPAPRVSKWKFRGIGKKKKKKNAQKREYRPKTVTNIHMPELFQGKQPDTFN